MREWLADQLFVHAFRLNMLTMVLVGGGVWMLGYQAWLGSNAQRAEATVLGQEIAPPGVTLNNPRTRLAFVVNHRRIECLDGALWPKISLEAGASVPVLYYESGQSAQCTIATFRRRWLLGALLLAGGLAVWGILGNVFVRANTRPELR